MYDITLYDQVWFTSDLHLGHKNILKYCERSFESVDEMNDAIIQNIIDTVGITDILFIVGDACMGHIAETLPLLDEIPCHTVLVPGNHDRVHPAYKMTVEKRETWRTEYQDVLDEVAPLKIQVDKYRVCHFPYVSDERHGDKYNEYLPVDDGMPLICGHVHDAWKTLDNMVNVGIDVWDYKPVNLNEIKELL